MKVKLKVTKKNIKEGRRCSVSSCPVAKALFARGFNTVRVFNDGSTEVYKDNDRYQSPSYNKLANAILQFDAKYGMAPNTYVLNYTKK